MGLKEKEGGRGKEEKKGKREERNIEGKKRQRDRDVKISGKRKGNNIFARTLPNAVTIQINSISLLILK